MSSKLPVGIDVDENGTTRLIQDLRAELEAAECSAREMHIAADNFLRERDALRAENERLREELAEWKAAHAHVVRLRELIESHMDTARGEWQCAEQIAALQESERLLRESVNALAQRGPYCAQHGEYQPCWQHRWAAADAPATEVQG